jgi:hypothetical protein
MQNYDYMGLAEQRLTADGCTVTHERWGERQVMVGHRSDFTVRWMATTLHLITAVVTQPWVSPTDIESFTETALDTAIARKGDWRGFQIGIAVLPCLVGQAADPQAVSWAQSQQRLRFAVIGRPVVVDVRSDVVGAYLGAPLLGRVYAGHLRTKINQYFPRPSEG